MLTFAAVIGGKYGREDYQQPNAGAHRDEPLSAFRDGELHQGKSGRRS